MYFQALGTHYVSDRSSTDKLQLPFRILMLQNDAKIRMSRVMYRRSVDNQKIYKIVASITHNTRTDTVICYYYREIDLYCA